MPGYVLDHHLEGLTWLRRARSFTMSRNAEKVLEPQEVRAFWEG